MPQPSHQGAEFTPTSVEIHIINGVKTLREFNKVKVFIDAVTNT